MHIFADIGVGFDRARLERERAGAVDAGGVAAVHLDEHARKALDVFEHLLAFFRAVHRDELVSVDILLERLDDAAADGIVFRAVDAALRVRGQAGDLVQHDALILEHGGKVFKGQNAVHHAALARFPLFGDARADEYDFRLGIFFAYHFGVRDHRGVDGREVLQRLRVIQFDHRVDGGAAGGDKVFITPPFEQLFILRRDLARADARFLRVGKAQPAEGEFHHVEILQIKAGNKGRRDGRDHAAALDEALDLLPFGMHAFCVLRADLGAVAAQNTAALNDLCVVVDHLDRLDGALAQAFIAVFAARVFEIEVLNHTSAPAVILRADIPA